MMKQTEQMVTVDDGLFLQEYLRTADQNPDQRPDIEASALEFATQIDGRDAQLVALNAIFALLQDPASSDKGKGLIAELEDEKFGFGIAEITTEDIPIAIDRILLAKNPAFVVRGLQYEHFGIDILQELTEGTGLKCVRQTLFPTPGMPAQDSRLHQDNFIDRKPKPGYDYTLTAARVNRGSVYFIGGFASKAATKLSPTSYHAKQDAINTHPAVDRLYRDAHMTDHLAPRVIQIDELHTELHGISLHKNDVVVWPQGGLGSAAPVWHAVRQLGVPSSPDFVSRQTTSYHIA